MKISRTLLCAGTMLALISLSSKASVLEKERPLTEAIDQCSLRGTNKQEATSFLTNIKEWTAYYEEHSVPLEMNEIYQYFKVDHGPDALGLNDLHYCELESSLLERSLKKTPDQKTIDRLNSFFKGNVDYEKLFSCLAQVESLGDADTERSMAVYKKITGSLNKPEGVKFYLDKLQPEESQLNIGLYQFTPTINGNIHSCIKAWNQLFKSQSSCQLKNDQDALRALGSPAQNFNVFCGIHKIIETASIQLYSQKKSAHFKSDESCVSLQMRAQLAYNHFGPLQNSTGKNLEELSRCLIH